MQGAICSKWPLFLREWAFAKVATQQMRPSEHALRGFQSDPELFRGSLKVTDIENIQ